jgi:L-fuconolactonase
MTQPSTRIQPSPASSTKPRISAIDAHLHLWDRSVSDYAWLVPEHGALYADFSPLQAKAELDAAGVAGAVLVQAEDSLADTQFLLDVAQNHSWVRGVVGWVDLEHPADAKAALDRWQQHPAFKGIRHLVHDDPRDEFLSMPSVRDSLRLLAARGLAFDVPNAWPRHLGAVTELAGDIPNLTVVIDHLAKPPRGTADFPDWERGLRAAAELPNTVAKFSGLGAAGQPFTPAALREVWDVALAAFGPSRLMYGGDWPMTVPSGGYQATWDVLCTLIGELPPAEQASILAGTAITTYSLDTAPDTSPHTSGDTE